jgi:hypothetical protein
MKVMSDRRLRPNAVSHTDDGRLIGQLQRDDRWRDHWDSNHRTVICYTVQEFGRLPARPGIRKMTSEESKATDSHSGDGEQKMGSGQKGRGRLDRRGQIVEEHRHAGAIGDAMVGG